MPSNRKKSSFIWARLIFKNEHTLDQQLATSLYEEDDRQKTLWQSIALQNKFEAGLVDKISAVIEKHDRTQHLLKINQRHNGVSALGLAIQQGNAEAVLKLMHFGCTIRSAFSEHKGLPEVIRRFKDHDFLHLIIFQIKEKILDVEQQFDAMHHHIFRIVLTEQHSYKTVLMLLNMGIDPNLAVNDDYHILASLFDDPYRCLFTLVCGKLSPENIHYASETRPSPLMLACQQADLGAVEMLLQNSACSSTIHRGKNALHYLAMAKVSPEKAFIIVRIAHLLLQAGAQINQADQEGNTPLMQALRHHHVALAVDYLTHADINIHVRNQHGENALSIAILGGILPCCVDLIQYEQQQISPPYRITAVPAQLPQNFVTKILPILCSKAHTQLSITTALSPISIAILLRINRPEMDRLISWLLDTHIPGHQIMDDPYHLAVPLVDHHSIAQLLQHGIPVKPSMLQPLFEREDDVSQTLKAYFDKIKQIERLLLQGAYLAAMQASQALDIITIPSHWPIQHWQGFADAYIIACLEADSVTIAAQRLYRVLYTASIYSLINKNLPYQTDRDTLVHKMLRQIISQIQALGKQSELSSRLTSTETISTSTLESNETDSNGSDSIPKDEDLNLSSQQESTIQTQQSAIAQPFCSGSTSLNSEQTSMAQAMNGGAPLSGLDTAHDSSEKVQSSTASITADALNRNGDYPDTCSIIDALDRQKLSPSDATDLQTNFEDKRTYWQQLVDQLLSKSNNDRKPTVQSDLKSMFLTLLHEQTFKALFSHDSPPEYTIEALRLLNQCPCAISRRVIANEIQIWFTENALIQEQTLAQNVLIDGQLCQSFDATQFMLDTHQKLFDQIDQRPLDVDETLRLAYLLFMLKLSVSQVTSINLEPAREFYHAMCYSIMDDNQFLNESRSLIGWLKAYDQRIELLSESSIQKDLLIVCQSKSEKMDTRDEAYEIFVLVAPYLNESIIEEIIHQPQIIHYLLGHQRLQIVQNVSTRLAQILQSYGYVRLIENGKQNKERGQPSRAQVFACDDTSAADDTTVLEEHLDCVIAELEGKIEKTQLELQNVSSNSEARALRIEAVETELVETQATLQKITRENNELKSQVIDQKSTTQALKQLKKDKTLLSQELASTKKTLSSKETAYQDSQAMLRDQQRESQEKIDIYRDKMATLLREHGQVKEFASTLQKKEQLREFWHGQQVKQLEDTLRETKSKCHDSEQHAHQQAKAFQAEIHELKKALADERKQSQSSQVRLESANDLLKEENLALQSEIFRQLPANSMFYVNPIQTYSHLILNTGQDQTVMPLIKCINEICQSIIEVDAYAQIQWGGSTAIMFARKELRLVSLEQFNYISGLIKSQQEDIDITVITAQSSDVRKLIANRSDAQNGKSKRPRFRITPSKTSCCIDLQLRERQQVSTHPDAIVWIWNSADQNWYLPLASCQVHQQAFLWDNRQLLPSSFPSYSLYRALHQWIKQRAFGLDSALSVPLFLLQQRLATSTKEQVSNEIIALLNHFQTTSYWSTALSSLFEVVQVNEKNLTLLSNLLPDQATMPQLSYTKTALQSVATVPDVLCTIKQHWATTETNSLLLKERTPINWNAVPNSHDITLKR